MFRQPEELRRILATATQYHVLDVGTRAPVKLPQQIPALSTITMIDEPEVSLRPELLSLLADLMREAAKRTRLIVATHSDRFIRFLQPSEVVVMDMDEDGAAIATWADSPDLKAWLAEYSLDDVWRMGRMGGRS